MKRKVSKRDRLRLLVLGSAIAFFLASIIPGRIAVAFYQAPISQAILVLGSASERMELAARFWQSHSNLDKIFGFLITLGT